MGYEVTTQNTRRAIAESLKRSMLDKPFSKITVSEIVADCGLNRKTFYYHFDDIYALLKWMLEDEAIRVVQGFDLLSDYDEAIRFVMDYVDANDYVINCACDAIGQEGMKRFFYDDFIDITGSIIGQAAKRSDAELDPEFLEFLAKFFTEALAGTLLDWTKHREQRDRERTVAYLSAILRSVVECIERSGEALRGASGVPLT